MRGDADTWHLAPILSIARLTPLDFDMLLEVVQNALPPLPLLLRSIFIFCCKRFCHLCPIPGLKELDGDKSVVSELEVQGLLWRYLDEDTLEIKAKGSIFGLHSVLESTSNSQINFCLGTTPLIDGEVPLGDVIGRNPGIPNLLGRGRNFSFYGDVHG